MFSRKNSGRPNGNDGAVNGNGSAKTPFSMKRTDSNNPAQNASIPNIPLPKAPDPNTDPAGYLRSIYAVRERSTLVLEKAKRNQLRHFHVDMSKFADTARFVVSIIKVCVEGMRSTCLSKLTYREARLRTGLSVNTTARTMAAL